MVLCSSVAPLLSLVRLDYPGLLGRRNLCHTICSDDLQGWDKSPQLRIRQAHEELFDALFLLPIAKISNFEGFGTMSQHRDKSLVL
jgi:hypothetical protein